jgi:hypothetical protein
MVHHICLVRFLEPVSDEILERLMVETRIRLLKIPEVLNLRVGKRINPQRNPYGFFFSFDTEDMQKLGIIRESAVYVQFERQVLEPHPHEAFELDFEMEPGKDVRYS